MLRGACSCPGEQAGERGEVALCAACISTVSSSASITLPSWSVTFCSRNRSSAARRRKGSAQSPQQMAQDHVHQLIEEQRRNPRGAAAQAGRARRPRSSAPRPAGRGTPAVPGSCRGRRHRRAAASRALGHRRAAGSRAAPCAARRSAGAGFRHPHQLGAQHEGAQEIVARDPAGPRRRSVGQAIARGAPEVRHRVSLSLVVRDHRDQILAWRPPPGRARSRGSARRCRPARSSRSTASSVLTLWLQRLQANSTSPRAPPATRLLRARARHSAG